MGNSPGALAGAICLLDGALEPGFGAAGAKNTLRPGFRVDDGSLPGAGRLDLPA